MKKDGTDIHISTKRISLLFPLILGGGYDPSERGC